MGLDIVAYSHVEFLKVLEDVDGWWNGLEEIEDEERDGCDLVTISPDIPFPARSYALRPKDAAGVYVYKASGEVVDFRAGSYGGYNQWRENLSQIALGVSPEEVWGDEDAFCRSPFYELINMSDCERVLDAEVCGRLLADFKKFDKKAQEYDAQTDGYFYDRYKLWKYAVDVASRGGCLIFC